MKVSQLSCSGRFSATISAISFLCLFAIVLYVVGVSPAIAQPIAIPMSPDQWQTDTGVFEKIQGVDALALRQGSAVANGVSFRDGTIEFDVQPLGMGAGVGFRRHDKDSFEYFYIRPDGKCTQSVTCLQYAPQTRGVLLWDLYPQFQATAPVRDGDWNHIRIVVSGQRADIYVNREESPSLKVGRMEGDSDAGGLSLEPPGYFANFSYTANATGGLSPVAQPDPSAEDVHLVRNWQLSAWSELSAGKDPSYEDMPPASAPWLPLTSERGGLVNITRHYGKPIESPRRALVWIKTTIRSDKAQSIKTSIGFVREVWVFENGKLVYADKNLFQPATARKPPAGRCSLQNGSFSLPLNAGSNEIAIAVANNFYGQGIILRPDDVTGLEFAGNK